MGFRPAALPTTSPASPPFCQTARAGTPSISTYVVGVFTPAELAQAQAALGTLATAGGTGVPFVLTATSDLTQRFLEALNQIRGAALACEFRIPPPTTGMLDFNNVRIKAAGSAEDLPYAEGPDRCDAIRGGWYYDVNPRMGTPTRIVLCPGSCNAVKADNNSGVELRFGCKSRTID